MFTDLSGQWDVRLSDGSVHTAVLPGTLDENQIGHPDAPDLSSRLTRCCTYEGPAVFSRTWEGAVPEGRLFLEVERSRALFLFIDGREISPLSRPTISTPYIFEVTHLLHPGSQLSFTCDNSYPGMPHDNIVYSSAATDETQTNWNGLLGYIRLRQEPYAFIESVRVYPHGRCLTVHVDLNSSLPFEGTLTLTCDALEAPVEQSVCQDGTLVFEDLPLQAGAALWDEYEGHLHTLQAVLSVGKESASVKDAVFGIRDFSWNEEGRFTLNGRVIFIRSEANCCEFPETGHAPMTVPEWLDILQTYQSYGINCMRFHSHCPPEAAFTAADQLGMLMQPELSHWNPRDAFMSPYSDAYYTAEAQAIVKTLANHPSFVMLTFGNELHTNAEGHRRMHRLIDRLHEQDATRLYADGSNVHYGQIGCDGPSDFYASQKFFKMDLRGTFGGMGGDYGSGMSGFINREYPSAVHHYNDTMQELRKVYRKPVFSFEVGQFEVLPDFDEIDDFHGVRLPVNLEIIRERVHERGLDAHWKEYVEATGEMSLLGYRAEIEAVLRTPGMSGISLLGLQDFTGQGTALVGMLNSHLQSKPFAFAKPERFRRFFNDVVLLALLPRYTYTAGEVVSIPIEAANYGKQALEGPVTWTLKQNEKAVCTGSFAASCPIGALTRLGEISLQPDACGRFDLILSFAGYENDYPLWVYADVPVPAPAGVKIAQTLDEETLRELEEGGCLFLSPKADKEILPHSIRNQFTTDFWSVGTFKGQEGGMSFLIDREHPALQEFPTEAHSNWQWWAMSSGLGVEVPQDLKSIVTLMDCYAYLRPLTSLLEARVGKGRLLFCSMGLLENTQYPEVRALLTSLLDYMASDSFRPEQTLDPDVLTGFFRK